MKHNVFTIAFCEATENCLTEMCQVLLAQVNLHVKGLPAPLLSDSKALEEALKSLYRYTLSRYDFLDLSELNIPNEEFIQELLGSSFEQVVEDRRRASSV